MDTPVYKTDILVFISKQYSFIYFNSFQF